ncbi:MAG: photosystem II S4 domain protein [Synechococcus sp.]
MMLSRQELLSGSQDPAGLDALITLANQVLRTWEPQWSCFLSAPLREEAMQRLGALTELQLHADGGRPNAERQCLLMSRCESGNTPQDEHPLPVMGLEIEGNFLFDPVKPHEMRAAVLELGISEGELGDLWIRGDRGAQMLCTPAAAMALHGRSSQVRDVAIQLEQRPVASLQPPASRIPKQFTSVEASCRLDAIASAGFGLSRAKVLNQIRNGRLRLNWQAVRQASKALNVGDQLQLLDRGSVEVLALERTKKNRWRVHIERR